ncbi:hypothetical protein C8R45DRAFT_1040167 [Mycena sanguinolenta]|nr:hypothetical protein C8R45DRAFT_1040167 [Mycena sanguinolenta]
MRCLADWSLASPHPALRLVRFGFSYLTDWYTISLIAAICISILGILTHSISYASTLYIPRPASFPYYICASTYTGLVYVLELMTSFI